MNRIQAEFAAQSLIAQDRALTELIALGTRLKRAQEASTAMEIMTGAQMVAFVKRRTGLNQADICRISGMTHPTIRAIVTGRKPTAGQKAQFKWVLCVAGLNCEG